MKHTELEKRMKQYEYVTRNYLTRRTPVIIRIDGRAFHTFTKHFDRPFDELLSKTMRETTLALCKEIQGCKLGYTQSDEISLLLIDYDALDTCAWFDNNIQKMISISASLATFYFNKFFAANLNEALSTLSQDQLDVYKTACEKGAIFDSRVFNVPKEEVTNYFLCRQDDASKNSVSMVGQHYFSHADLYKKSTNAIQEMLFTQKGVNWNNYPTMYKRGSCCIKVQDTLSERKKWVIDLEIPQFKGAGREYIEKLV